jgi:hypothetical protein
MKCIVKNCINQTHEGQFVGDLCAPCHKFVTTTDEIHSQAYRNAQRQWVGLTDEEAKKAFAEHNCDISKDLAGILARAIEAKLKEKNT